MQTNNITRCPQNSSSWCWANIKYSCNLFEEVDFQDEAEQAMLDLYIERAGIANNQDVLDLGCGWGSFRSVQQSGFLPLVLPALTIRRLKSTTSKIKQNKRE